MAKFALQFTVIYLVTIDMLSKVTASCLRHKNMSFITSVTEEIVWNSVLTGESDESLACFADENTFIINTEVADRKMIFPSVEDV